MRVRAITCVVLGAGFLVVAAGLAGALQANGVCDQGEYCFYKDVGFQGCRTDVEYYDETAAGDFGDQKYVTCKDQMAKDSVSSYQNRTTGWLLLWEHPGRKGFRYCVAPRASGNVTPNFNDKASSIAIVHPADFPAVGGEGKCNHVDRD